MYEFRGLELKKKKKPPSHCFFWGEVALVSFFAGEFFSCDFSFSGLEVQWDEDHR